MKRVTSLSDSANIAAPSPELCLIAGLIIAQGRGKPKKIAAMVDGVRDFVDAHTAMGHNVMRIRGAEYDQQVLDSMSAAADWLERVEPFLMMMARR